MYDLHPIKKAGLRIAGCLLLSVSVAAAQPRAGLCPDAASVDEQWYRLTPRQLLDSLRQGISCAKKDRDPGAEANWLRRLGIFYADSGALGKAAAAYLEAAQKSEAAGDAVAAASNNNQLGVVYYKLKAYPLAAKYFRSAAGLYEQNDYHTGVADASANVAETLMMMDSLEQAGPWLRKSIYARSLSGDAANIGPDQFAMALYFRKQRMRDSALYYYNESIASFNRNNKVKNVIEALNARAALCLETDIGNARKSYQMAYDTASRYMIFSPMKESLTGLYRCCLMKRDTQEAFRYLQLKTVLSDTMMNEAEQLAIINAFHTEQLEIKDAALKTKNAMLLSIVIILISIIAIAVLVIKRSADRKKLALKDAELHRKRVDELLQDQEMENVNSMLKGQNIERKRIAQDLHDRLGSILATVKLHFTNMEDAIAQLQLQQGRSYEEANLLLDEACQEVRRISHDLYEGSLDKFGFSTALSQLIAAIEKTNKISISYMESHVTASTFKPFEKDLYRITQELLSNTLKHADAGRVTIQLNEHPQMLIYMYEDNGKGFSQEKQAAGPGIGYKNIASRVENMKASWSVDTSPGHGITVVIEIPLP